MFSSHWPPSLLFVVKALALLIGVAASLVGWWAAHLWWQASKVAINDTTPHTAVSYGDNPALGILEALVSVNATQAAYNASATLNGNAARWTAGAAILTGVATGLAAL